jgi:hypothetical protein
MGEKKDMRQRRKKGQLDEGWNMQGRNVEEEGILKSKT